MKNTHNSNDYPNILITNDDGVNSPGLLAAADAVSGFANVTIIAPLSQQTAMGRAQRGDPQARLEMVELISGDNKYNAYACDASPARVVGHGLKVMPDYTPDLVISGINYGENLGNNITSSGTVGAAIEGATKGIPSIAISLETPIDSHYDYRTLDWNVAMYFLRHFVQKTLSEGFPAGTDVLKIDVPSSATTSCPWRVTRLSGNAYYSSNITNPSLQSRLCDAVTSKGTCAEKEEPDTDVYALAIDQVVSVTPLSLDLTAYDSFAAFDNWQEK